MKRNAIFSNLIFVLSIVSFFSCSTQEDKPIEIKQLLGHWHLIDVEKSIVLGLKRFQSVDFFEDSTIIFDGGLRDKVPAHFVPEKNQIWISFSYGFGGEFEFSIKDDLLIITSEEYHGDYIAQRCKDSCCDKQKDYFEKLKVDIDLPIRHQDNCVAHKYKTLEMELFFGFNKNQQSKLEGYHSGFVIDETFSEENLNIYKNNFFSSKPKHAHHKTYVLIYADKKVKIQTISPVINQSNALGINHFYFALRNNDYSNGLKICMKEIDLEKLNHPLNQDLTLEEWLSKK